MDPLTLSLIMGGGGLLKSLISDGPKASRQRKLAAETQRLSPWTGLQAGPVKEADPLGSALQFGLTGAQVGSNLEESARQADLDKALSERLNTGGSISGYGKNTYGGANMFGQSKMKKYSPWNFNY